MKMHMDMIQQAMMPEVGPDGQPIQPAAPPGSNSPLSGENANVATQ
jgi:hypothetical protein